MLKTKKIFGIIIISIIMLFYICTTCYAAVPVTEENLKESFKELFGASEDVSVKISNNIINLNMGDEEFIFYYDLTGKNPAFSVRVPIKKGMTYDEFINETKKITSQIILYTVVANIQGTELADSSSYMLKSFIEDNSYSSEAYIIVDDINNSYNGEKTNDSKTIYVSEFGDRVMEYVNYTYKDTRVVTDSDTYTWSIGQEDVTDTSCSIVSTLTVNLDGNFEKIKGTYTDLDSAFDDALEASKELQEAQKKEEELSSGKVNVNGVVNSNELETNKKEEELSSGKVNVNGIVDNNKLATNKEDNTLTPEEQARQIEKAILKEMEKEYRAERNKIPNAGDTTMLVLKAITIVSIIALVVVIVCSRKRKV